MANIKRLKNSSVSQPGWKKTLRTIAIVFSAIVGVLFVVGLLGAISFIMIFGFGTLNTFSIVIPADEAVWHTFTAEKLGITFSYPTSEKYPDAYTPNDARYDDMTLTDSGAIDTFDPEAPGNMSQGDRTWKYWHVNFGEFDLLWTDRVEDTGNAETCTVNSYVARCYNATRNTDYVKSPYVGYLFDYKGQQFAVRFFGDKEMNTTEQAILNSLVLTE